MLGARRYASTRILPDTSDWHQNLQEGTKSDSNSINKHIPGGNLKAALILLAVFSFVQRWSRVGEIGAAI